MKYIIKRIIIGVGIALSMFFLKGLILDVYALEVDMKPDSFNLGNSNFTSTSVIGGQFTYTNNGTTTYSMWQSNPQLPSFSGTDWLYLPYSTISSNSFCVETDNTGSFNSVFLNPYPTGSANPFSSQNKVQIQPIDQSSNPRDCTITYQDNAKIEFNCTNVDFTKNYRIILTPVRSAPIFIWQKFNINCIAPDSSNSDIINNNNNNTTNIINNNNTNTETIINNQNENTDKQIESQKVCNSYNLNNNNITGVSSKKRLNYQGGLIDSDDYNTTGFISIDSDKTYSLNYNSAINIRNYCFYDSNKNFISCYEGGSQLSSYQISNSSASYVRFIYPISNNNFIFTGQYCSNGNQAVSDGLVDLNHTLNDTSAPDSPVISAFLNDLGLPDDTPISSLLLMPITLFQAYQTGLNGECYRYRLGNLYGTNLDLPCIHPELYLGDTIWGVIDAICCIFLIYRIGMLLIFFFEKITTLSGNLDFMITTPSGYGSSWGGRE